MVSKAKDRCKGKGQKDSIVAIKKIRMARYKDGVSITALREIKLLQEIKHENVIGLLDVYASKTNVNMVIEFCLTDLEEIIRDRSILLTPAEIKCMMQMILRGIEACHQKWILHRDLKPSNILIGADGNLKIGDFGLARLHGSPNLRLTHQVITRWYRPPELLYAACSYSAAVDMWSVGCIFAELMLRLPYMPGDSDIDQLAKIFQARGTPTAKTWPGCSELPAYIEFDETPVPDHKLLFMASSPDSLSLLDEMMRLNPSERISAADALKHGYFTTEVPAACSKEELLAKVLSGQVAQADDGAGSGGEVTKKGGVNAVTGDASEIAKDVGQRRLF